jgi:hypothetical protein
VRLVVGAFSTLSEAEAAARALLDAGHSQELIAAYGRVGGGRLLLAGRVPLFAVGDPARLVSRAERARAWAAVGAAAALVLGIGAIVLARLLGHDVLRWSVPPLAGWPLIVVGLALVTIAGGGLAALAHRTDGLPHELAVRYGMRLDQGDTVISVRTAPGGEARAAQEIFGLNGAVFAHVTRGNVEPLDAPPPGVTLAPSPN